MLLVPVGEKASNLSIEKWKAFAKKMNQELRLYNHDARDASVLVKRREAA